VPFFYSRKINQRRIQNQLEAMFRVSLSLVLQIREIAKVSITSETIASDKAHQFV